MNWDLAFYQSQIKICQDPQFKNLVATISTGNYHKNKRVRRLAENILERTNAPSISNVLGAAQEACRLRSIEALLNHSINRMMEYVQ